jgi:hypothetical protein
MMNPIRSFARALRRCLAARPPRRPARPAPLWPEPLEARDVPSGNPVRSIDGSGNNLAHPSWGKAGTDFLRVAPAQYADGASAPAGSSRPSARVISNAVSDQHDQDIISDRALSAMTYAWGQFIDHDLDLTKSGTGAFNVPVPAGDPTFDPAGTGTQVIPLTRSAGDPATGTSPANPRQQVNTITAWLDGSMIYGSDATTTASLRTFQGGKLKTSAGNLLPTDAAGFFLAGDVRANENGELTSLHTLFVREHNRVAGQIAAANPSLSDEQVYQQARAWVIAEVEAITYNEWLPSLLGPGAIAPYSGYRPNVNPAISNEFATGGFRFGHSMLGDDVEFLGNDGTEIAPAVSLAQAFFNPSLVQQNGIDPLLKYLSSDPASEIDTKVVDSVRNMLITSPGMTTNLDLASLNLQRGRDHGLADYNTTRAAYGLPRVTSFAQITSNLALRAQLMSLYGNVNNIDLWVGALAEDHVKGGSVGPTVRAILVDQFTRLRDGDRFWYENTFAGPQLGQLRNTHLADVIQRNTKLTTIQKNPFVFQAGVSGTVFADPNRDGRQQPGEPGTGGRIVQVIDTASGEVVATAKTDPAGHYRIGVPDGLRTGRYVVHQVLPPGITSTTPDRPVTIISGDVFLIGVDHGSVLANGTPPSGGTQQPPPPTGGTQPLPPPSGGQTTQQAGSPPLAPTSTHLPPDTSGDPLALPGRPRR